MKRTVVIGSAMATVLALAACGERPQTATGSNKDTASYQGTGSNFVQQGWTPGDKTSWEQHLRARQQRGQNDYSRMP